MGNIKLTESELLLYKKLKSSGLLDDEEFVDILLTLVEGAREGTYLNETYFLTHKHEAWRGEIEKAITTIQNILKFYKENY